MDSIFPRLVRSLLVGILFCTFGLFLLSQAVWSQVFRPPPEPQIKPIVSAPKEADKDNSKVDDQLEETIAKAQAVLQSKSISSSEKQTALDTLNQQVPIELIFDQQITQDQIDAFLKSGGTIDHIFTNVSYGWTGKTALKDTVSLPKMMGNNLLGVIKQKPIQKHLDIAARTGRVRSMVWNAGFSGDSTITIAILDTGVDGTHSDLTGRQVYWKDWTADNRATAQDVGHHGSHVAGIAFGTGTSSGINPSTISFMDLGTFPSSAGSFFLSPFSIPTTVTSINWTSNMRWATGAGLQAQIGQLIEDTTGGFALISAVSSGAGSPLTETNNGITNPFPGYTNIYNSFPSKNSGGGTPEYAVQNTVSYAGVGDGYYTFRGIAPGARWAGLKVFQDNGSGSSIDIGEALDDLVTQRITYNIKVANMSLGINGNPGIDTGTRNKTNTAASNGIVMTCSAGNDGASSSGSAGEIDDPGRANFAITVVACSDVNQLTDYSSHGFNAPGDSNTGDDDMKPDIMAPGGSTKQSYIMSVDSNTGDSEDNTGSNFSDAVTNNYLNLQGTSMASPFMAGCAALAINALQNTGSTWHFTGTSAIDDVRKVKMLLLMTASESNKTRESGSASGNPTLDRGAKDINEGYGKVNMDACIEAIVSTYNIGNIATDSLSTTDMGKKVWARKINLTTSTLTTTLTVPAGADYDLYLYSYSPDTYGNPVILGASTSATLGIMTERVVYASPSTQSAYIVIKQVSGLGTFTLSTPALPVAVVLSDFAIEPSKQ